MADKQIIKDGVDVSGCEFYFNGCCSSNGYANCTDTPNCYYKRMMHTGAELNIHKTDKEHAYKRIAELQAELKAKEQEYKKLRFPMKDTNYAILTKEEFENFNQLKAENEELKNFHINLVGVKKCEIRELVKYKQALTEIKEIAEKIDDSDGCAYGDYDCDNCSSLEQETVCTYKVKKLILQKISEVSDEN